ncbi:lysylphosphatidylglycerol synthase domain-containing protein [Methylobacterium nigriterrae]|uniref:lysylphosphatidylglycerol synthase domain-containing protein n=1 Tax=Methylobacterium nigriterrae TaxID=3127512 RepID=UPI003013A8CE
MAGIGGPRGRSVRGAVLRRLPLVGTLLGLGLALWLVATNDLGAVAAAFGRIGVPGLAAIVAVRACIVLICGVAWARILNGLAPVETGAFVLLRYVREGINVLLPVASVGGDVVGGRLLTFWGVSGTLAAASILADLLIQAGTLALFALFGAGLLGQVEGEAAASLSGWMLRALAVAALVLGAFFVVQRSGALRVAERRLARLGRRFVREAEPASGEGRPAASAGPAASVQDALDAVWGRGRRGRLAQSAALHLLAWMAGAVEIWIVLACIGVEGVGAADVLVIEALAQAIKSVAFPIPSGLGVQEGGFVVVGALFGIDAGTAIALSLAKRVPDVAIGLPALLAWQNLEARRVAVVPPR